MQYKRSVPADTFQELLVSLVLSRLYYGNATLAGLPASLLSRLQVVMNAGARLISIANRREHVVPVPLALRLGGDHFQSGDTDVPMRQRDCRREADVPGRKHLC